MLHRRLNVPPRIGAGSGSRASHRAAGRRLGRPASILPSLRSADASAAALWPPLRAAACRDSKSLPGSAFARESVIGTGAKPAPGKQWRARAIASNPLRAGVAPHALRQARGTVPCGPASPVKGRCADLLARSVLALTGCAPLRPAGSPLTAPALRTPNPQAQGTRSNTGTAAAALAMVVCRDCRSQKDEGLAGRADEGSGAL